MVVCCPMLHCIKATASYLDEAGPSNHVGKNILLLGLRHRCGCVRPTRIQVSDLAKGKLWTRKC